MHYTEFRKAAERHLVACEYMLAQIDSVSDTDKDKILKDIYYLSGYVIECMLKYAYFSCQKPSVWHPKDSIKEHPKYQNKGFLSSHKINILWEELSKIDKTIRVKPSIYHLQWQVSVRYESSLVPSDITAKAPFHLKETRIFFNTLKSKFQ